MPCTCTIYEFVYYLIYGNKVHYPVYRIDGKYIILGTCHTNHIDSIDKNILNEIELCDALCVEVSINFSEKIINVILDNIYSSFEDKIVNLINSFEIKFKSDNKIDFYNFFYKKSFINRIKHNFINEEVNIIEILEFHRCIITLFYGMDNIINLKFLSKKNKIISLDIKDEEKNISYGFKKLFTYNSFDIFKIIDIINFIKYYLLSFHNFIK